MQLNVLLRAGLRWGLQGCVLCLTVGIAPHVVWGGNLTTKQAVASITSGEMQVVVELLADDSFEGRAAGSRGGRAAAGYLAKQFAALPLVGGGDKGSYFQSFGRGYRNILALLEGSDPELKREVVVIGAHYDHVGYGKRTNSLGPIGYIHNGADDNASGTAAVLEVAEAISQLNLRPKRTILFALWDGEEAGLLGSKHWVAVPTLELSRIRFVVNLDMVGRLKNDELEVFGARTAAGLRRLVCEQNASTRLKLKMPWKLEHNSDHAPFLLQDIPVLMFHTGLHDDYHRPSDDAHLINYDGMQRVTRFAFGVINEVANLPALPAFREASHREYAFPRKRPKKMSFPPRLGMSWRREQGEMRVTRVTPRLPAAAGGLQVGDVVVQWNGQPVPDDTVFKQWVLAASDSSTLQVRRAGTEELLEIPVTLQGRRTRVGLRWMMDEAEPEVGRVLNVFPGSAAELAGITVGDRVYTVNGNGFQNNEELRILLTTSKSPLTLQFERQGQIQTRTLEVPAPSQSL